jgi:hypothetical protein
MIKAAETNGKQTIPNDNDLTKINLFQLFYRIVQWREDHTARPKN